MTKSNNDAPRICFCSFPFPTESTRVHTYVVIEILKPVASKLTVISGNMPKGIALGPEVDFRPLRVQMHARASGRLRWWSTVKWAAKYVAVQVEMSYRLIRMSRQTDIIVFHEGPHYPLPTITGKLLRKKVVKYTPAAISVMHSYRRFSLDWWASFGFKVLERVVHGLPNRIIIPTEDKENRLGMGRYRKNIAVAMYAYIDEVFQQKKDWDERGNTIGFIGRLNEIRGALKLAQAIPMILEKKKDVRFLIVGEGPLQEEMKRVLAQANCLEKVEFVGWVPNDRIPDYLNEMKFHVSPARWDSPGTINLEAMACGTVAMAKAVGGVPDIVLDNETGFLLKDNEPRTIADRIVEVWDRPDLQRIRENSRRFVEDNYSRQKVIEAWKKALDGL